MSKLDLPAWYYALAVVFAALCAAPYACFKWQEWADRKDAEAWANVPGSVR